MAYARTTVGQTDIYSIEPDGTNPEQLTTNTAGDGHPTWSPDGTKIAFFSERVTDGAIYVMNSDGSDEQRKTDVPVGGPLWQPCPSTCASVVEQVPPISMITQPSPGTSYTSNQLTSFTGTAIDVPTRVAKVQVSLRKTTAQGACLWWDGSRFVSRGCSKPLWLKAQGKTSWSFALAARLRPTIDSAAYYRVRCRATDIVGNRETTFETGRNSIVFEIE